MSYRFGRVEVSPVERRLTVDGKVVAIGARAFDVLLVLVERCNHLVSRDELLDLVWSNAAVEPNNLAVQVGALRKKLGPDVIATIPGRGYRLSAAIDERPRIVATAEPAVAAERLRTNLPERPAALIGRDEDVVTVGELVDAHRLVTIVGAGGIGKTRLAQQLLHDRRDAWQHGVCWVELASLTDAAALPGTIATALNISLGGGDPAAALQTALAPLAILIGLDNAEHLAGGIANLVEALLARCAGVRLVVTSQMPLRLPDEQVVRLRALAVPEENATAIDAMKCGAVALFVQRARAADARFVFDDGNAPAVITLCGRLDGLPLAIEFAAARASVLGVERIVASLDERLQLLKGNHPSAPLRQQTMRAALEWSHQWLGPDERVVFRRMAVLASSASLELIEAIAVDDDPVVDGSLDRWRVVDALGALIDRSLVAVLPDARDPDRPRYRLLETPRAYAAEQLEQAGEVALLEARHARAMAALLSDAWVDRWNGKVGYLAWIDRVEADRENARLASGWALRNRAWDLVLAMAPVLLTRSWQGTPYDEREALANAIDSWLATQPAEPGQLATRIQLMRFRSERQLPRGLMAAGDALALAEKCGDRFATYCIEAWLVRMHAQMQDLDAAAAALTRARALENADWPTIRLVIYAEAASALAFVSGPPSGALEPVRRELRLAIAAGYDGRIAASNLIAMESAAGNHAAAVAAGNRLLEELRESRNQFAITLVRLNLSAALLALGDVERARPVIRAALQTARLFELHGDCADYLALLCALERRWPAAALLMGYADAVHARHGAQRWPTEKQAHEQTVRLASAALGAPALAQFVADGGRLSDSEIATIAFEGDS